MTPTTQAIDQATSQILPQDVLNLFPGFLDHKEGDVVRSTTLYDWYFDALGELDWIEDTDNQADLIEMNEGATETIVTLGPRNPDGTWSIASCTGFCGADLTVLYLDLDVGEEPPSLSWVNRYKGWCLATTPIELCDEAIAGITYEGPLHFF